jgi:hypothetical protein
MLILVLFAFFSANAASLLAYFEKLIRELGISHYKARPLKTNVSAISRKLNTACHHSDVFLIQTTGSTRLAREGTVYQFLNHARLFMGQPFSRGGFCVFHN